MFFADKASGATPKGEFGHSFVMVTSCDDLAQMVGAFPVLKTAVEKGSM